MPARKSGMIPNLFNIRHLSFQSHHQSITLSHVTLSEDNNQQIISWWCSSVFLFKRQDKKLSPLPFPWRNGREMAQARTKLSELQDDRGRQVFIRFYIILEFSKSQTNGKPFFFFFPFCHIVKDGQNEKIRLCSWFQL